MKKVCFVLYFSAIYVVSSAQPTGAMINDYIKTIYSNETRLRTELKMTDTAFYESLDSLTAYCLDQRFTLGQQFQNVQGLARFLGRVNDRELLRSGRCANLLQFYYSIIDWRAEGNYYDKLNSYSGLAMLCASFFAEDSIGYRFISHEAEVDPDEVMTFADQLSYTQRYRSVIEAAVLQDPDFAKRYFHGNNPVSNYTSRTKIKEVAQIYDLFEKYGTRTASFTLFDDISKGLLSPDQADSIARDSKAMISNLVAILERHNPYGLRSVLRELEYRAVEWMRNSTELSQGAAINQYGRFSPEEKLVVLILAYRECSRPLFNIYLSQLERSELGIVNQNLLDNLGVGPLPSFLRYLDRNDKVSGFLYFFKEATRDKLSQMLAPEINGTRAANIGNLPKRSVSEKTNENLPKNPSERPVDKPKPMVTEDHSTNSVKAPASGTDANNNPSLKTQTPPTLASASGKSTAPSVSTSSAKELKPTSAVISGAAPVYSNNSAKTAADPITRPANNATASLTASFPAAPTPAAPAPLRPVIKRPATTTENYEDLVVEPVHVPQTDSSKTVLALKKNIFLALQDIPSFVQKPYARDIMLYAATVEPDEVFQKIEMYKSKYWCRDILEQATLNAPLYAKRYLNNTIHPVSVILKYSNDTVIQKFLELSRQAKFQSKPFLLFDEMAKNCITLSDATTLCQDNSTLFKELMQIAAQKNYIGRYNVEQEMNYYALKYIRAINDKVDEPEAERFSGIDNLSCDEIYYLMVYGREEVFDETFKGLFSRFLGKCSATGYWNAQKFINLPHYRSFIAMCAAYNKLDKFLSLFNIADQNLLITTFASSLEKERDALASASTVAETVSNTSNTVVLQVLQNTLKASYLNLEMAKDYNGMAIYGILCALFKDKAVSDKKWFAIMGKKYRVGALTTLLNSSLMDKKVFVERMYFYNDDDGRDSYKNFINTFSASPNWRVEQFFSYAKVSSYKGNKIEIYANKPELEESGEKEISKIIEDNNYEVKAIVHRGHSFHTDATLELVPSTARFILIGSCGGFYKINLALRKAPDAHVVSTRQVGVKEVNDPIIFKFSEYVRQGKDVNWRVFWDEMKERLSSSKYFNDYVPPHKNLESLFVHAYYQIMGNE